MLTIYQAPVLVFLGVVTPQGALSYGGSQHGIAAGEN